MDCGGIFKVQWKQPYAFGNQCNGNIDAEGTLFTIYELSNRESLKMLIWKNNYPKGFFFNISLIKAQM